MVLCMFIKDLKIKQHKNTGSKYYMHSTGKETEAQRDCPSLHQKPVAEQGLALC